MPLEAVNDEVSAVSFPVIVALVWSYPG